MSFNYKSLMFFLALFHPVSLSSFEIWTLSNTEKLLRPVDKKNSDKICWAWFFCTNAVEVIVVAVVNASVCIRLFRIVITFRSFFSKSLAFNCQWTHCWSDITSDMLQWSAAYKWMAHRPCRERESGEKQVDPRVKRETRQHSGNVARAHIFLFYLLKMLNETQQQCFSRPLRLSKWYLF